MDYSKNLSDLLKSLKGAQLSGAKNDNQVKKEEKKKTETAFDGSGMNLLSSNTNEDNIYGVSFSAPAPQSASSQEKADSEKANLARQASQQSAATAGNSAPQLDKLIKRLRRPGQSNKPKTQEPVNNPPVDPGKTDPTVEPTVDPSTEPKVKEDVVVKNPDGTTTITKANGAIEYYDAQGDLTKLKLGNTEISVPDYSKISYNEDDKTVTMQRRDTDAALGFVMTYDYENGQFIEGKLLDNKNGEVLKIANQKIEFNSDGTVTVTSADGATVTKYDADGKGNIVVQDVKLYDEVEFSNGLKYNIANWDNLSDITKAKVEKIFNTSNNGISAQGIFYAFITENSDGTIKVSNRVLGQVMYVNNAWVSRDATFEFDDSGNIKSFSVNEYQFGTENTRVRNFDADGKEIKDEKSYDEVKIGDDTYEIQGWEDLNDADKAKVQKVLQSGFSKILGTTVAVSVAEDGSITITNNGEDATGSVWYPESVKVTFDSNGNISGREVTEKMIIPNGTQTLKYDKDGNLEQISGNIKLGGSATSRDNANLTFRNNDDTLVNLNLSNKTGADNEFSYTISPDGKVTINANNLEISTGKEDLYNPVGKKVLEQEIAMTDFTIVGNNNKITGSDLVDNITVDGTGNLVDMKGGADNIRILKPGNKVVEDASDNVTVSGTPEVVPPNEGDEGDNGKIVFPSGTEIPLNEGENAQVNEDGSVTVTSGDGKTTTKYDNTGDKIFDVTDEREGDVSNKYPKVDVDNSKIIFEDGTEITLGDGQSAVINEDNVLVINPGVYNNETTKIDEVNITGFNSAKPEPEDVITEFWVNINGQTAKLPGGEIDPKTITGVNANDDLSEITVIAGGKTYTFEKGDDGKYTLKTSGSADNPGSETGDLGSAKWAQDVLGIPANVLDAENFTIEKDNQGRIVSITPKEGVNGSTYEIEYTENGVILTETRNLPEDVIPEDDFNTEVTTFDNDGNKVKTEKTYPNGDKLTVIGNKYEMKNADGETVWTVTNNGNNNEMISGLEEYPGSLIYVNNDAHITNSHMLNDGDEVTIAQDGTATIENKKEKSLQVLDSQGGTIVKFTNNCELEEKPVLRKTADGYGVKFVAKGGIGMPTSLELPKGAEVNVDEDGNVTVKNGNNTAKLNQYGDTIFSVVDNCELETKPVLDDGVITFVPRGERAPERYIIQNDEVVTINADGSVTIKDKTGEVVKEFDINGCTPAPKQDDETKEITFNNGDKLILNEGETATIFNDERVVAVKTDDNKVRYYDFDGKQIGSVDASAHPESLATDENGLVLGIKLSDGSIKTDLLDENVVIDSEGNITSTKTIENKPQNLADYTIEQVTKFNPDGTLASSTIKITDANGKTYNIPTAEGLDAKSITDFSAPKNFGLVISTDDKKFVFVKDGDGYKLLDSFDKGTTVNFTDNGIQVIEGTKITNYDTNGNVLSAGSTAIGTEEWIMAILGVENLNDFTIQKDDAGEKIVSLTKDGLTININYHADENDNITVTKDFSAATGNNALSKVVTTFDKDGNLLNTEETVLNPESGVTKKVTVKDASGQIISVKFYNGETQLQAFDYVKELYNAIVETTNNANNKKNTTAANIEKALRALSPEQMLRMFDFDGNGTVELNDIKEKTTNSNYFFKLITGNQTKVDKYESQFNEAFINVFYDYVVNEGKFNANGYGNIRLNSGQRFDVKQKALETTGIVASTGKALSATSAPTTACKSYTNGNPTTGTVVHNGKEYYFRNGYLANGYYAFKNEQGVEVMRYYKNGVPSAVTNSLGTKYGADGYVVNGIVGTGSSALLYVNGSPLTGINPADGKFYNAGKLAIGVYNNVYYNNGVACSPKLTNGLPTVHGDFYGPDGKLLTGTCAQDGKEYIDGRALTGLKGGVGYVAGVLDSSIPTVQVLDRNADEVKNAQLSNITVTELFKRLNLSKKDLNDNTSTGNLTKKEFITAYMTTDNPELKKILSFFIDDDGNGNINANKYFALVSKAGTARTSSNAENIVQTEFLNLLGLTKANSPITEESLSFLEKRMAEYEFLASGKKSTAEYDSTNKRYMFDFTTRQLSSLPTEPVNYQDILAPLYDANGNPDMVAWRLLSNGEANTGTTINLSFVLGHDKDYMKKVRKAADLIRTMDLAAYDSTIGYTQKSYNGTVTADERNALLVVLDSIHGWNELSASDKANIKAIFSKAVEKYGNITLKTSELYKVAMEIL